MKSSSHNNEDKETEQLNSLLENSDSENDVDILESERNTVVQCNDENLEGVSSLSSECNSCEAVLNQSLFSQSVNSLQPSLFSEQSEQEDKVGLHSETSSNNSDKDTFETSNMDGMIDTFLEFTGQQNREKALRYLILANGNLEAAVNLSFTAGSSDLLQLPLLSSNLNQTVDNLQINALNVSVLQNLQSTPTTSLMNLVSSESTNNLNSEQNLVEDIASSFLFLPEIKMDDVLSKKLLNGNKTKSHQSIFHLKSPDSTLQQLEDLQFLLSEEVPEIGTGCLKSIDNFTDLFKRGLVELICASLVKSILIEDNNASLRFLQLLEFNIRIITDGFFKTIQNCSRWFYFTKTAHESAKFTSSYC